LKPGEFLTFLSSFRIQYSNLNLESVSGATKNKHEASASDNAVLSEITQVETIPSVEREVLGSITW
jgi:hypothetical protein